MIAYGYGDEEGTTSAIPRVVTFTSTADLVSWAEKRPVKREKPTSREQSIQARAAMLQRCASIRARQRWLREALVVRAKWIDGMVHRLLADGARLDDIIVGIDRDYRPGIRTLIIVGSMLSCDLKQDFAVDDRR